MKPLVLLFLVAFLLGSCTTTPQEYGDPEPYREEEFSRGAKDLRRAEIIFLGALPLSYMLTNLLYDSIMDNTTGAEGESTNFTTDYHTRNKLTIALSASAVISLTDYLLGLGERKKDSD